MRISVNCVIRLERGKAKLVKNIWPKPQYFIKTRPVKKTIISTIHSYFRMERVTKILTISNNNQPFPC